MIKIPTPRGFVNLVGCRAVASPFPSAAPTALSILSAAVPWSPVPIRRACGFFICIGCRSVASPFSSSALAALSILSAAVPWPPRSHLPLPRICHLYRLPCRGLPVSIRRARSFVNIVGCRAVASPFPSAAPATLLFQSAAVSWPPRSHPPRTQLCQSCRLPCRGLPVPICRASGFVICIGCLAVVSPFPSAAPEALSILSAAVPWPPRSHPPRPRLCHLYRLPCRGLPVSIRRARGFVNLVGGRAVASPFPSAAPTALSILSAAVPWSPVPIRRARGFVT
jgi:hypothetical protein